MEIVVTGRRTDVPDRFRQHVEDKLSRVAKLDPNLFRVDVEVSREQNPRQSDLAERVELTCRSRGPVIRAEAAADERYAALDLACKKLEAKLRKSADRRHDHRLLESLADLPPTNGTLPTVVATTTPPEPDEADVVPVRVLVGGLEVHGDGPLVVREKRHAAEPMTLDQALYRMELVGHDFFLFVDRNEGLPSVVYRRRGFDYGVIRLSADGSGAAPEPDSANS